MQRLDDIQLAFPQVRRLAWAVLLFSFLAFCTIAFTLGYSMWRYASNATVMPDALLFADVPSGVTYQPRGSAAFITVESAGNGSRLAEGDQVRVAPASSAGYGKVASIELADGSSLDIRAGTQITLDTYRRSRWGTRLQAITVGQQSGYVRYNLRPNSTFAQSTFVVSLGNGIVAELDRGGSYSVHVRPSSRTLLLAGTTQRSLPDSRIEVAVRGSGHAVVRSDEQSVALDAGQLVVVAGGLPQQPLPAAWELIRDNALDQFSQQEYNNTTQLDAGPTLVRSNTWIVSGQPTGDPQPKEAQGRFGVVRECLQPQPNADCPQVNTAQFIRTGGQTQGFITAITQYLGDSVAAPSSPQSRQPDREADPERSGDDVSEYRSLRLSADLRILNQSLDKGGQAGTECPLLLRVFYKQRTPADDQLQQVFCFWYKDGDAGTVNANTRGYFESYQISQYTWTHIDIDLRDTQYLPDARFLQRIQIEARGHDYNAEITNISLVGSQ